MTHYEDLKGATGDDIHFREPQLAVKQVFPQIRPRVHLDGAPVDLESTSMSRVSVRADRRAAGTFADNQRIALRIDLGVTTLFDGPAQIAAVEPSRAGDRLHLDLEPNFFPLDTARELHRDLAARTRLGSGFLDLATRVSPDYRALCADIVHTVRGYRQALEEMPADADPARRDAFFEHVRGIAMHEWRQAWFAANALCRPLMDGDPEILRATKRYTEIVVTQEMLDGAIIHRSYTKPLGYPGDHRVMNMVYAQEIIGDTPFARLAHILGLHPAYCIHTRMKMIEADIRALAAQTPRDRPLNVANLGCGTAQETQNIVSDTTLDRSIHFTLIDQDDLALTFAHRATRPGVAHHGGRMRVDALHSSFIDMMKAGRVFGTLAPQDFIFSVGLLDYLNAKRCRNLVEALYEQLAPGGLLAVANLKDGPESALWPMEFFTDWSVIFRTHEDMREMAAGLTDAEIWLEDDSTGRVVMLRARKPG